MERLFDRDEAQQVLDEIRPSVEELTILHAALMTARETHAVSGNGTLQAAELTGERLQRVKELTAAIVERGIVLRDPASGLIDFPSERDGEQVYLCWRLDDGAQLGWWHDRESGYDHRQPL